jgi:glutamine synthetase
MVGSSQSIATPNTYLNTALAQVLSEYADKLEAAAAAAPEASALQAAINKKIQDIIKESYARHSRVVFNGNGYSEEWLREAERRGLPNVKGAVEALSVLTTPEAVALFETHKVLTREELESRYHIYLEKYSKQINIEAGVMIEMARRGIFPAASSYSASLARDAASLAAIGAKSSPQETRAKRLAELSCELHAETAKLEDALARAQTVDGAVAQATFFYERVKPAMEAVRERGDALEQLVPPDVWPYPGYEELLFKL